MTKEQKQQVEECGSVGFDYRQVAVLTGLDPSAVKEQFTNEKGEVYEAYQLGRVKAELELRKQVLVAAKSDIPRADQMVEKMMEYYHHADSEHRDLLG
jgi:cupin superfamily acireductone dioxygenase involved in methionine salvage